MVDVALFWNNSHLTPHLLPLFTLLVHESKMSEIKHRAPTMHLVSRTNEPSSSGSLKRTPKEWITLAETTPQNSNFPSRGVWWVVWGPGGTFRPQSRKPSGLCVHWHLMSKKNKKKFQCWGYGLPYSNAVTVTLQILTQSALTRSDALCCFRKSYSKLFDALRPPSSPSPPPLVNASSCWLQAIFQGSRVR